MREKSRVDKALQKKLLAVATGHLRAGEKERSKKT